MKNITLVRHNSYLFKGTVEENLRMAKPDARGGDERSSFQSQSYGISGQTKGT